MSAGLRGRRLGFLALLVLVSSFAPVPAGAEVPAAIARQIAVAEDERRWSDGELRRLLSHANPAVRARAALAVGRIQDTTSVEALVPLLEDAATPVRREATFALGQIGHRSARDGLLGRLTDSDHETSTLAIEALGKLGDKRATERVAGYLADAQPAKRSAAAVALWRLADSTALDALADRHADPDPEVRWRVLYALEKIVAPSRVALLAATHLEDSNWLVRAYAARTLGRQKSPRATAYLLQALDDPEAGVVVNAIRALQMIADTTCSRCVGRLSSLLGHRHPYVRVTAALALADPFAFRSADSLRRAAAIESLTVHLLDPDAATRGASARALAAQRGPGIWPLLHRVLADSSLYARVAAIDGLRVLPSTGDWVSLVRERMRPGRPTLERTTAAEVFGAWKAQGAVTALREGLRDTSLLYVAASAGALAEMRDSASVRALATAYAERAADAEPDARIALRDALRELGGARLADSLEKKHPARTKGPSAHAPDFAAAATTRGARLVTTAGDIEWSFFGAEAPQTVKNFASLARRGYFDGTWFHRVVPNFVIQDGDPTGTGSGGPGHTIRCEYNRLHYEPGMVGMALSGKDTGGSQWFINHSPQLHLDGRYTIFARVTKGMDVVNRIVQGDRVLKVEILP